MFKKVTLIALAVMLCLGTTAFAGAQPSDWAKGEINPDYPAMFTNMEVDIDYQRPITRAEFAALAFDVYGDINEGYPNIEVKKVFSDIGAKRVELVVPMAAALGIVNGVSETQFNPDAPITREQICTMLARISEKLDTAYAAKLSAANTSNVLAGYIDAQYISYWAKDAVSFCVYTGTMNGVSATELAPYANVTVEQAMVLCSRLVK